MKKTVGILLSGILSLSAMACFAGCGSSLPEDAVVIYTEYNGLTGKDDDLVKAELQRKFQEDTGESITLMVEPHSTSTQGQKVTGAIGAGERLDAIVTHYSSDSFVTSMMTGEKELKDLTSLVTEYAPNYLARFTPETDAGYLALNKGRFNGKVYALSSLEHNSIFGLLVNKEHMKFTDFDPEEYDVANENYKSLTISEFTTMLRQLKERVGDGKNRPLGGAPYDIEYFIDPVFKSSGYTHMELIGEELYPAWATESYCNVLEYERLLQVERLWTESPLSSGTVERDFMAGKSSVYAPFPEVTQQIETARKLKKTQGAPDCIMLAPLRADGEEESSGNARHASAFLGLVVPKNGKNTELLLKFINWLSLKENYEIAKYGIKGTHWVEATAESGAEAYAYPEDKREAYEETPPYSGVYCLLTDVHTSDRIYAGYTAQEKKWVEEVHAFPSYPANGYDDEGINMPSIPITNRKLIMQHSKMSDEYVAMRANAWSDVELSTTITEQHTALVKKVNNPDEYKIYIDFLTEEYQKIKENFMK